MSPLLPRGVLIGVTLLAVVGFVLAAPRQQAAPLAHAVLAQSPSSESLPISDTGPEPMARVTPRPTPTPAAQPQALAARVPATTVRIKPAAGPPAPPQVTAGTGQWGLINQDRQAKGLAPLQWSPCLANVATGQAARMAAQGYISHANGRSLDLACHLGPLASESIGFQAGGINDAAMNAWFMGDPPHRANIMGPYHYIGVAWVLAPNGTAYLAVEFG
jgi:uncharacterized protein YkwD